MSNARSPREVCSTTIGIRGIGALLLPLAAGGPDLRLLRRLALLRRPDRLARLRELRRDRLHLGRDPVERLLHPQVLADAIGAALLDELLDVLVALALLAELPADVFVGDLDGELVGDRLEQHLARDRLLGLLAKPLLEEARVGARRLQVRARVDAARVEAAHEGGEELARTHLDDEPGRFDPRRLHELVDGPLPEPPLDVLLEV